jgi:hypothetical protein
MCSNFFQSTFAKSNFSASGKIRPNPSTHGFYEIITGIYIYMVGGFNPSEKYEFVSWDNYS